MKKIFFAILLLLAVAGFSFAQVNQGNCSNCTAGYSIVLNGDTTLTGNIVFPGYTIGTQYKALTNSSAVSFVSITFPALTGTGNGFIGGIIQYCLNADNGTEVQSRCGSVPFSGVNKAGTTTCTVGTPGAATEIVAVSSGTLTNTIATTTAANTCTFQDTPVSSLTPTSLAIRYRVILTTDKTAVTAVLPL